MWWLLTSDKWFADLAFADHDIKKLFYLFEWGITNHIYFQCTLGLLGEKVHCKNEPRAIIWFMLSNIDMHMGYFSVICSTHDVWALSETRERVVYRRSANRAKSSNSLIIYILSKVQTENEKRMWMRNLKYTNDWQKVYSCSIVNCKVTHSDVL